MKIKDRERQTIATNIKHFRIRANLTQDELAKRTGYTDRSSIAKIEKGLVDLPQSKLQQFADALGVTLISLMGLDEEAETALVNDDEELNEYLEVLKNRPEMRMLFQLSKDASKEDVEAAVRIIEALRK